MLLLSHVMPRVQLLKGRGGILYSRPTELMAGRRVFATALVVLIALTAQIAAQYFLAKGAVRAVRWTTLVGLFSRSHNLPARAMRRR